MLFIADAQAWTFTSNRSAPAPASVEKRTFGTYTSELGESQQWLKGCGVTHVVMGSTGVYWLPVWGLWEGTFALMLVNPQHFRAVPGRKTDQKDCEWLAQLLQYGLLRGSFVPPQEIRELRELTRYRVRLLGRRNQVHNRIEKLLQQANVKLSSVATDILGVTEEAFSRGFWEAMRMPNPSPIAPRARCSARKTS